MALLPTYICAWFFPLWLTVRVLGIVLTSAEGKWEFWGDNVAANALPASIRAVTGPWPGSW
jgi:hypothetical protein